MNRMCTAHRKDTEGKTLKPCKVGEVVPVYSCLDNGMGRGPWGARSVSELRGAANRGSRVEVFVGRCLTFLVGFVVAVNCRILVCTSVH